MKKQISVGGRVLEYRLTRKKVKNINLRIRHDGSIAVSAGRWVSDFVIESFLLSRADFILSALAKAEARRNKAMVAAGVDGGRTVIFGRELGITAERGEVCRGYIDGQSLVLVLPRTEDRQAASCLLENVRMELCRRRVIGLCRLYYPIFEKYNVCYPEIKFKSMVSKWGSCNITTKTLTFNYALINAPLEAVEYVVVHELTHFLYPNHQKEFHNFVASILPDHKARRAILKTIPIRDYKQININN